MCHEAHAGGAAPFLLGALPARGGASPERASGPGQPSCTQCNSRMKVSVAAPGPSSILAASPGSCGAGCDKRKGGSAQRGPWPGTPQRPPPLWGGSAVHTTADETKVRVVWPGEGGLAGNPAQICLFTGHLVSLRPRGTTGTLEIREGLRSQKGHLGGGPRVDCTASMGCRGGRGLPRILRPPVAYAT